MDSQYDDRLLLPDLQLAVETVALPKTLTVLPILLGAIFILFSILSVNTIRKSISKKPGLLSPQNDKSQNKWASGEENNSLGTAGDYPPGISAVFTPEVKRWREYIANWSVEYDLPPNLIAVVIQIESCGNPHARSPAGAIGLFQVMPYHFSSHEDPFEVPINAARGLDYLSKGLKLGGGRIDLALAGYNGGHSQITKSPQQWTDETTRYVRWGLGIWEDIQAAESRSETLDLWLESGGRFLCENTSDG
jgi:hypothetical protein